MTTIKLLSLLSILMLLHGCAAAVVAGGATAVTVASDRRTLGNQVDDSAIAMQIRRLLAADELTAKGSNINVTSYNGVVLLTGQTATENIRQRATSLTGTIEGVQEIHNQIRLGNNTSLTTRTRDSWITTKVKSQLLTDSAVSGLNIRVVTENSEVFLMGLVSKAEADKAVEITRHVEGVSRVIRAFETRDH